MKFEALRKNNIVLPCCSCTDLFAILRDTLKKTCGLFFVFMFTRNILQIFILKKSQNCCFCFIDFIGILANGRRMTPATLADWNLGYYFLLFNAC